jgi:hypothetical protein
VPGGYTFQVFWLKKAGTGGRARTGCGVGTIGTPAFTSVGQTPITVGPTATGHRLIVTVCDVVSGRPA